MWTRRPGRGIALEGSRRSLLSVRSCSRVARLHCARWADRRSLSTQTGIDRMTKVDEVKALVVITVAGFAVNALSLVGLLFEGNSLPQLLSYRVGDTAALMACATASRYVGAKGLHVAASAFAMLGIVHGISASASGLSSINVEATANVIMPMVPAFVLLMWCTIFPLWIRLGSVALAIPFGTVFYRTIAGLDFFHWTLGLAYGSLATMELLWAACLWQDFKNNERHTI